MDSERECDACRAKLVAWWSIGAFLILAGVSIALKDAGPVSGYVAATIAGVTGGACGVRLSPLFSRGSSSSPVADAPPAAPTFPPTPGQGPSGGGPASQ